MKHSSTWFALILILSALLLSTARNATAESPSQPNQSAQTETSAQQHDAVANPAATTLNQQTTKPAASSGTTNIYNQYQQSSPWGDFPTWLEAVASIGLVIFAYWQINFVKRTTTASEDAAKAARDAVIATQQYVELTKDLAATTKQSVDLARLSLSTERPYITVTPVNIVPTTVGARVNFTLRNEGRTPAIIKDIVAGLKWETYPDCPSFQKRRDGVRSRRIHEYVLGTDRTSREYSSWYEDVPPELKMDDAAQLLKTILDQRDHSNRELHLFGFVLYADPAGAKYVVEFCWNITAFSSTEMQFYLDIFLDMAVPPDFEFPTS
jgi:hypothetical protein